MSVTAFKFALSAAGHERMHARVTGILIRLFFITSSETLFYRFFFQKTYINSAQQIRHVLFSFIVTTIGPRSRWSSRPCWGKGVSEGFWGILVIWNTCYGRSIFFYLCCNLLYIFYEFTTYSSNYLSNI